MRKLNVNTGGMSRPSKPMPQIKKVVPPAVPDIYRYSGASFGAVHYSTADETVVYCPASASVQQQDPQQQQVQINEYDENVVTTTINNVTYLAPDGSIVTGAGVPSFSLSAPRRGDPLTHKAAVLYHQQLALQEDQGIDLTQSPGRDSPSSSFGSAGSGSGSRHSTASLDSGRASSYLTGASVSSNRSGGSGSSSSGGGIYGTLSSPRCSISYCSIGSVDRMSNARTDHDIISEWLAELHYDEYASLFVAAGYDLPTIARMTPEDLTAIGIRKPHHRERIKQLIDSLHMPDNLPTYVPGSIEEWLRLLRLEEYAPQILSQGYESVRDVTQLTWEDLEDIGIVKLGHQKKILLAIKRVKDIISGKLVPCSPTSFNVEPIIHTQQIRLQDEQAIEYLHDSTDPRKDSNITSFSRNPTKLDPYYTNNLPYGCKQTIQPWRRSFDDGDITPTNEIIGNHCNDHYHHGSGTLPRQSSRLCGDMSMTLSLSGVGGSTMNEKKRPVAKVTATNLTVLPQNNQHLNDYHLAQQQQNNLCNSFNNMKLANNPNLHQYANQAILESSKELLNSQQQQQQQQAAQQYQYYPQINSLNSKQLSYHQNQLYNNSSNAFAGQTQQTTVEIHHQAHENKSNSSIDSIDQIPFANENAGTIKQRTLNRIEHQISSNSEKITSPQQQQQQSSSLTSPTSCIYSNTTPTSASPNDILLDQAKLQSVVVDTNVLNDIGNMLANLTDELDAMLEEEKRIGLNDSE
uniref:Putative caskin n=1 Tax=Corethrella appendiculata TaxID=1370023 RepID=U5ESM8_9DIPT